MKIYDISVSIEQGMHVFPGDPKFRSHPVKSLEAGEPYASHSLSMGNHAGTHVDAPAHFIQGGGTVTDIPLEVLNGRCRVIEIHDRDKVDADELQQVLHTEDFRILFKTTNSMLWGNHKHFSKKYVYLTEDAAKFLCDSGIKLIGFDYLSVEKFGDEKYPVHKALLSNNIALLEGLNLGEVEEGQYELACLPLRLVGFDAAPARAILKK